MEFQITNEVENKTLERKELEFSGEGNRITPSREEVLDKLAERIAVRKEFIVIKSIRNLYGSHKFAGSAHVYTNKEKLQEVEPEYILKRGKSKKEAGKKEGEKEKAPVKKEEKKLKKFFFSSRRRHTR